MLSIITKILQNSLQIHLYPKLLSIPSIHFILHCIVSLHNKQQISTKLHFQFNITFLINLVRCKKMYNHLKATRKDLDKHMHLGITRMQSPCSSLSGRIHKAMPFSWPHLQWMSTSPKDSTLQLETFLLPFFKEPILAENNLVPSLGEDIY